LSRHRWVFFVVVVALFSLPLVGYLALYFWAQSQPSVTSVDTAPAWPPAAGTDASVPSPPFSGFNDTWAEHRDQTLGFSFRYPPGWEVVEASGIVGVLVFPPGANQRYPLGVISFAYVEDAPFQLGRAIRSPHPAHQGLTIAGRASHWYEDPKTTLPVQSLYVETPLRQGTLVITATEGPKQNLAPVLVEMLKHVDLQ
jgi:hypothetical protein